YFIEVRLIIRNRHKMKIHQENIIIVTKKVGVLLKIKYIEGRNLPKNNKKITTVQIKSRENSKYTHLFNRNSKYTHEFSKTPKIPNTIYCKGDVIVFIVSQMHRVLENAQCITTVGNHQRITEK